ncbi:hypothetical protein M0R45_006445 [Rubus argutus]|uniref:Uncharacterized protein n=1 Tax=Rubus argutus TaxID=59490 RepID=A0AAW1YQN3_RUBAR
MSGLFFFLSFPSTKPTQPCEELLPLMVGKYPQSRVCSTEFGQFSPLISGQIGRKTKIGFEAFNPSNTFVPMIFTVDYRKRKIELRKWLHRGTFNGHISNSAEN